MKLQYHSFLLIALIFSGNIFCDDEVQEITPEALEVSEAPEDTSNNSTSSKSNESLEYNDMPLLPIDQIEETKSSTLPQNFKKLRHRSKNSENEGSEQDLRFRQR